MRKKNCRCCLYELISDFRNPLNVLTLRETFFRFSTAKQTTGLKKQQQQQQQQLQ